MPKTDQIWPEIGIFGHLGPGLAGSFNARLVSWLVVMARGLYLARHLFTLFGDIIQSTVQNGIYVVWSSADMFCNDLEFGDLEFLLLVS